MNNNMSERIKIDSPFGTYEIKQISEENNVEVSCSGNACSNVRHRFTDVRNRLDFKYEIRNKSNKEIEAKLYWYDFLGKTHPSVTQTIWPGESFKFHPGRNNQIKISVQRIIVNYK